MKKQKATPLTSYDLDGYEPGYPPAKPGALIDAASIDMQVCAEVPCPVCGSMGGEYYPYVSRDGNSYRAFAVCPKCGNAEEF